jgi:hypothetical protein
MGEGAEVRRHSGLPLIAGATDIVAGNPVTFSASRAWQVVTAKDNTTEIIGIARASARANKGIDIRDVGDIVRGIAAATINSGELVGIASLSTTEGASGLVQVAQLAPITRASGSARWTLGPAVENANPKEEFAYYVNPKQISGLA